MRKPRIRRLRGSTGEAPRALAQRGWSAFRRETLVLNALPCLNAPRPWPRRSRSGPGRQQPEKDELEESRGDADGQRRTLHDPEADDGGREGHRQHESVEQDEDDAGEPPGQPAAPRDELHELRIRANPRVDSLTHLNESPLSPPPRHSVNVYRNHSRAVSARARVSEGDRTKFRRNRAGRLCDQSLSYLRRRARGRRGREHSIPRAALVRTGCPSQGQRR